MYSFPDLEPVCSMSASNCCFLTCIQISQEAGQVVWYSHLFQNFPQFVVINIVKGFGLINKADVFLEFSYFFYDPMDVGNLTSVSSAFSKSSLNYLHDHLHNKTIIYLFQRYCFLIISEYLLIVGPSTIMGINPHITCGFNQPWIM